MSDHGQTDEPRPRRRGGSADGTPPPSYDQPGGAPPGDDPMAALEQRLQAMTPGVPAEPPAPAPQVTTYSAPPQTLAGPPRSRPRPRPAARRRRGFGIATVAAPIVFLVAIIALVSLVYQSGIVGGDETSPTVTPTPKATKTKSGGNSGGGSTVKVTTKKYTVKDGDTLSAIAVKYDTTVNAILALNPDMSASTLVVGTKIKVPTPSPSSSPSP